ncbi:MAG: gliding motility-associated protein GldE [Rikenellaceae bacterium]
MTYLSAITYNGFAPDNWLLLISTILLLALSALVSGAEAAFFSLTHEDIKQIKDRKTSQSKATIALLEDVDMLLATILIVNNLVNICISIFAASLIDSIFTFHNFEFIFKVVVVTFLLLLFGEIAPKVFAQRAPQSFALFAARSLKICRSLVYPFSKLLVKAGSKLQGASHHSEITFDELADAVDMTESATKEEKVMLSGILNFINTDVSEIMHSRVDITAVELSDSYQKVKDTIIASGYSRIPVYDQTLDSIRGVLYVKDLIPYIKCEDYHWQRLIRKPYFVPEHKRINSLLEEFQTGKVHLAIVVDEYGSTLGLVSLEDIIEEIVGEISDESDNDEQYFTRLDRNTYIFEGKTHIGDFERVLELDEDLFNDTKGQAETLAGLFLEVKKSLPKLGDKFTAHDIKFTITAMGGDGGRRIEKIRVVVSEVEIEQ